MIENQLKSFKNQLDLQQFENNKLNNHISSLNKTLEDFEKSKEIIRELRDKLDI